MKISLSDRYNNNYEKLSIMEKINFIFSIMLIYSTLSYTQDMFTLRQPTSDPSQEGFATWSPDGKKLAFGKNFDIWVMVIDIDKIRKELNN